MPERATVLVTGGAGFIGSRLARDLLDRGLDVLIADDLSTGRMENIPKRARFARVNLADPSQYGALDGPVPMAVLHLAAQSSGARSFKEPEADLDSHVRATFHLLRWCLERGVRRMLYASSCAVYGDSGADPAVEERVPAPKSYYAAGKAAAEGYIRLFDTLGVRATILRMPNVYGPGQDMANMDQGMVSIYLAYLMSGRPILVKGSGERFRDFIHIDDVASAWLMALDSPASVSRTFNVSTGEKATVARLLGLMLESRGVPDHPVEYAGGTDGDQFGVLPDNSALRSALGWSPRVSLKEGVTRLVAWAGSAS
jgi:UDP-glucose 4-epimerase